MDKAAYSIREVCTILGLSRKTVFNLVDEGRLVAIKLTRKTLIVKSSLDRLLGANQ